jgi:hypothetical protein
MTYAIDEMAPIMWVFFLVIVVVAFFAVGHFIYVWAASNPCAAYNLISHWWGRVGDHCVGA